MNGAVDGPLHEGALVRIGLFGVAVAGGAGRRGGHGRVRQQRQAAQRGGGLNQGATGHHGKSPFGLRHEPTEKGSPARHEPRRECDAPFGARRASKEACLRSHTVAGRKVVSSVAETRRPTARQTSCWVTALPRSSALRINSNLDFCVTRAANAATEDAIRRHARHERWHAEHPPDSAYST